MPTEPPIPAAAGIRPAAPFLTQLLVAGLGVGRTSRGTRAGDASRVYREAVRPTPRKGLRGVA